MKALRGIGGVIAGVAIAVCFVMGAEAISNQMYPPPAGMDPFHPDMAKLGAFIATLPASALILVLSGHLLGTLAGTFVASKIGASPIPGFIAGAVLLTVGTANAFVIPQPVWFSAASIVGYIAMTLAGVALARPRREPDRPSTMPGA